MYTGLGLTEEEIRANARAIYTSAQRAFDAGQFSNALMLFREAYATMPNPVVLAAIGMSLHRLGRVEEAANAYREYLRLVPQGADVPRVQEALRTISGGVPVHATVQTPALDQGSVPNVPRAPYGASDIDSLVIVGVASAGVVAIGIAAWALSRRKSRPNRRQARRSRSYRRAA